MRVLLFSLPLMFVATGAHAHWGHVGELAGHAHWVGLAAGACAVTVAALLAKQKKEAEAKEDGEQDEPVDDLEPEAVEA